MVSHKHQCIFIHVPKTGGMSIENAFLSSLGLRFYIGESPPLLLVYNKNKNIGPKSLAHLCPLEYVKNSYISQEQFDSYFKFGIVRNPYDRIVSLYKHFKYPRFISFDNFIKHEFPKLLISYYYFIKPQVEYLVNEGEIMVDYIGKFENLDKEMLTIKKCLKHSIADLEHINKSFKKYNIYSRWNISFIYKSLREKPYLIPYLDIRDKTTLKSMDFFTQESLDFVNDFYHLDFQEFGYEKIRKK